MTGGTQIYCPCCKGIQICAAIPLSSLGEESIQHCRRTGYETVHFFRRARKCQTCYETFITAELDENLLNELVRLKEFEKKQKLKVTPKDFSKYTNDQIKRAILKVLREGKGGWLLEKNLPTKVGVYLNIKGLRGQAKKDFTAKVNRAKAALLNSKPAKIKKNKRKSTIVLIDKPIKN